MLVFYHFNVRCRDLTWVLTLRTSLPNLALVQHYFRDSYDFFYYWPSLWRLVKDLPAYDVTELCGEGPNAVSLWVDRPPVEVRDRCVVDRRLGRVVMRLSVLCRSWRRCTLLSMPASTWWSRWGWIWSWHGLMATTTHQMRLVPGGGPDNNESWVNAVPTPGR